MDFFNSESDGIDIQLDEDYNCVGSDNNFADSLCNHGQSERQCNTSTCVRSQASSPYITSTTQPITQQQQQSTPYQDMMPSYDSYTLQSLANPDSMGRQSCYSSTESVLPKDIFPDKDIFPQTCGSILPKPVTTDILVPKSTFHAMEGKLYMSVDYIISHPDKAVDIAMQYVRKNTLRQPTHRHKVEPGHEFHWNKEYSTLFAVACMAMGVTRVTPKQLQQVLPFEISRESVGSHLQKYRLKIQKQYQLSSLQEIKNTYYPRDIEDQRLLYLRKMWENGFQGLPTDRVKQILTQPGWGADGVFQSIK